MHKGQLLPQSGMPEAMSSSTTGRAGEAAQDSIIWQVLMMQQVQGQA